MASIASVTRLNVVDVTCAAGVPLIVTSKASEPVSD